LTYHLDEMPTVSLACEAGARAARRAWGDWLGALLLPPAIFGGLIFLSWAAHVWGTDLGLAPLIGLPWATSVGYRFAARQARSTTAGLFALLVFVALVSGGIGVACRLWALSDGSCF
jgi:hypothetical protein